MLSEFIYMIHIILGNTGAGKTSYCKKLQQKNGGIIFTIDEWNNSLFMSDKTDNDGLEWFLERLSRIENQMKKLVLQLEVSGIDSILDLGFSKFEHRAMFHEFAKKHHINTQTHFLDVNKTLRWERVQQRNLEKGDTYEFEVSKDNFEFMETWFERPNENELKDAIIFSE